MSEFLLLKINSKLILCHFISGNTYGELMEERLTLNKISPRYMMLLKNRNIDLEQIVTKTDVLKNINRVIENIKNGKIAGRAILNFS